MLQFISGNEAFYDDEKMLYNCYVGISDENKSLQYTAHGKTQKEAIDRGKSLAYLLNSVDKQLEKLANGN